MYSSPARSLILLLLAALAIRCTTVLQWSSQAGLGWPASLSQDTDSYLRLAVNLSQSGILGFEDSAGQVTPSAFRPPLYPWLLSWLESDGQIAAAGIAMMNITLGLLAVWLTWSIGQQLRLRWAWVACLAVVVDPILLRASQSAMTETLATTLALAAWRLWLSVLSPAESKVVADGESCDAPRRGATRWIGLVCLGLVFGLAILARPTAAPWAVLCVASMVVAGGGGWKSRFVDAALVSGCVLVCVVPWTVRNASYVGKPIWATSHGGYTLLLANNPPLYQHFGEHGPSRAWDADSFHAHWARRAIANTDVTRAEFWDSPLEGGAGQAGDQASRSLTEVEDDALAYQAAWATIGSQPAEFFLACGYRAGWLWAFWPNQSSWFAKLSIGLWYAVWFGLAALGVYRLARQHRWRAWLPGLLLMLVLTAVHSIYWSNMRMRAPVVACVYLLAIVPFQRKLTSIDSVPPALNTQLTDN